MQLNLEVVMFRSLIVTTGILAAGVLAAIAPTNIEAATLMRISSWAPPTHPQNNKVFPGWGKRISKATGGNVTTKIEYNLASPLKQFELVRDGVADAAWIFHGYNTRFVASQAIELPGLGATAEAASVASQAAFEGELYKAKEHRGVVVATMFSHGQAVIQTKKKIMSLGDLRGMKIRVPGGVGSMVGRALGVTAVKLPAPKVYEALSSRVADGVFMPMETQKTFRLKEVTPFVTVMPGGLYYGSFAIIMNPDFLKKLSASDRAAVMGTTGTKLAAFVGRIWENGDVAGMADAKKFGSKIQTASASMYSEYKGITAKLEADWIKRIGKRGADGRKALRIIRSTVASYGK
jgi:TRAP-type C4-dicarboxylate transport system substrate-binding protein